MHDSPAFPLTHRRLPREEVRRQAEALDKEVVRAVLDNLPHIIFILNTFRQVVLCNRHFLTLASAPAEERVIGLRPGEIFGCRRMPETPDGCGTGRDCSSCGAAQAILESLAGREGHEECRLSCQSGEAFTTMDMVVHTRPLAIAGQDFILYSMQDISHEKRRQALERIFFHDILNTATGLRGLIQFLADEAPPPMREDTSMLAGYFEQMVEEILTQKQLLDAEQDRLDVQPEDMDPGAFLDDLTPLYRTHPLAEGRNVCMGQACFGRTLRTDPVLLRRILDNMIKNALEAAASMTDVTVSCIATDEDLRFTVHNLGVVPEEARPHIFERSFSTKGSGRGLGTYGMRLLVERYLGGRVGFESSERDGTTFFVVLPWRM